MVIIVVTPPPRRHLEDEWPGASAKVSPRCGGALYNLRHNKYEQVNRGRSGSRAMNMIDVFCIDQADRGGSGARVLRLVIL